MSQQSVTTWKKSSGFAWSMIGSAVGFANILSFSSECYRNGGGAFLVPFVVAILILGLPMLILEGTIGRLWKLPIVSAFGRQAGSTGRFFGWISVIAVGTIGAFYIVLTGYSVAYTYFAGAGAIPADTATFFKSTFLHDTGALNRFGTLAWPVFLATLSVGVLSWFVLARNIQSGVERVCSIFLPILFGLTSLFAIAALFLPGAMLGIKQFLTPDWTYLADPTLWRNVFGQLFFSFSLGVGIVTGYSRYAKQTTSIPRVMLWVAVGDLVISLIAGLAIFCCVGYLSHTTGIPFSEIVHSDSSFEMGFVIFPKILHAFGPLGRPLGALFFFCIFIAGITGLFSIMESIIGNLQVEFRQSRRKAATLASGLIVAGSTLFCFGNGQAIIGALAPMVLGNNYLIGGLAEIAIFMFLSRAILQDPLWKTYRSTYWLLRFVIPCILLVILVTSIAQELHEGLTLIHAVRWGWIASAILLSAGLSRRGRTTSARLA